MNKGKLFGVGIALYGVYAWMKGRPRFAVQLPDQSIVDFGSSYDEWVKLDDALLHGGLPVIAAGDHVQQELTATQFQGGWLINNVPLNVVYGSGWLDGQLDALNAAGLVPYYPL